jgi:hypothetical protein
MFTHRFISNNRGVGIGQRVTPKARTLINSTISMLSWAGFLAFWEMPKRMGQHSAPNVRRLYLLGLTVYAAIVIA